MASLSSGALALIMNDQGRELVPVLQILSVVELGTGKVRYRVLVSDGMYSVQGIVTGVAAQQIAKGAITLHSFIRVTESQVNFVSEKKLLIIMNAALVANASGVVGNPQTLASNTTSAAATPVVVTAVAPATTAATTGVPMKGMDAPSGATGYPQHQYVPPAVAPVTYGAPSYGGAAMPNTTNTNAHHGAVVRVGGGMTTTTSSSSSSAAASTFLTPVASLNPYSNRWTIKVRVTSKSDVKSWSNEKSSGSLFKVDLLDEAGGEISAAFFKDAVTKFYDLLHVDGVYHMSGGRVKPADPRYSMGRLYEINFDEKANIFACPEDTNIQRMRYDIKPIATMSEYEKDSIVDVMGVLTHVGESTTIHAKSGRDMVKCDATLVDTSSASIDITMWGERVASMGLAPGNVLLVKGARVSDWNTRSLSTQSSSHMEINPDMPEAHALRGWYEGGNASSGAVRALSERGARGGGSGGLSSAEQGPILDMTQRYTISALKDDQLGTADGSMVIVKATVKYIKNEPDKIAYPACRSMRGDRACNKKLDQLMGAHGTGWSCAMCGPQAEPEYRYMLSVVLQDSTGDNFVTLFNAEAEALLGIPAGQLIACASDGSGFADQNAPAYTRYFTDAYWKQGIFSIKCKMDMRREESKIQTNAVKVRMLSDGDAYARECRSLIENIRKYMAAP